MCNWVRSDRVLAFVRLVGRPVTLKEITEALDDDLSAVSATVSKLWQEEELNRERVGNKYVHTDPAYDELLRLRRQARENANAH